MNNRRSLICGSVISVLALSGCAGNGFSLSELFSQPQSNENPAKAQSDTSETDVVASDNGIRYRAERREMLAMNQSRADDGHAVAVYRTPSTLYQPAFSHKSLADYAEQLTMELVKNGQQLNTQSRVGVASFVHFAHSLNRTSALGNQLAEMLISEVQSFGVPVIDFKTADAIVVDQRGDLVFSRQGRKLANNLNLDYVLSGTLIENERGVRINARIIAMGSKAVVSSASLTVPHFIVKSLQPNYVIIGE